METASRRPVLPFKWAFGEHIAIIGNTGSGKTRLAAYILESREWIISFKSKADNTKILGRHVKTDKDLSDPRFQRFVLYPDYFHQRIEFAKAFERVWKEGAWTHYLDELYALDQMKLVPFINRELTQGRSKDISVVSGMQRPVSVTRFAISQATHIIVFNQEGRDLKTITEITTPRLAEPITNLKRHEFVWYYVPTKEWWIGRLQELQKLTPKQELVNA